MQPLTTKDATEAIYASLIADNQDLDWHISNLKAAMAHEGQREAVFEAARLAQNNREGRKTMQAYFKKRGIKVKFAA